MAGFKFTFHVVSITNRNVFLLNKTYLTKREHFLPLFVNCCFEDFCMWYDSILNNYLVHVPIKHKPIKGTITTMTKRK